MKKTLIWILAAVVAAAVILLCVKRCNPDPEPQPEPVEVTFNQAFESDYDYMAEKFDTCFNFYEVQVELDGTLDSLGTNVKVAKMTSVAQTDDSVYFFVREHGLDGEVEIKTLHDIWLESAKFTKEDVKVTLEEALMVLNDSLETLPATKFVTLRNPIGPTLHEYPFYIFGQMLSTVNAGTGKVNDFVF